MLHRAVVLALPALLAIGACTLTTGGAPRPAGPGPIVLGADPEQPTTQPGVSRAAEMKPVTFVTGGTVPVGGDDPAWGGPDAAVTIVAFLDYQCPFCAEGWGVLGEVGARYGQDIRIVFKQLPLGMHQEAYPSAVAAVAVRALEGTNAFRRYSDLMFTHPDALSPTQREKWAAEVGIDALRFRSAIEDPRFAQQVVRDVRLAQQNGIDATPAFVINGLLVMGAAPIDAFAEVIDREMPEALAAQRQGLSPIAVYERRVKVNTETDD
jgi:protein-disulfide isomerase